MKNLNQKLVSTVFNEYIYKINKSEIELDFVIDLPFTMEKYCEALFKKIIHIGLSESSAFLDYQCSLVKQPILWINSLEKLIKENLNHFDTRPLHHRQVKFVSEISIKRHELMEKASKPLRYEKKLNGYNAEKEYSFATVKELLVAYETSDEKISFLQNQIYDYKQSPPDFLSTKEQPFDLQCQIEIERIEKQEIHNQKIKEKKNALVTGKKLPVQADLKILCDIYFKMINKKSRNGKRMFPWTIAQATDHICNSFCEADGSALNSSTVRTYLSSSKPESRPKIEREFDID
ncbi:MAG: hypothetical protein FD155_1821 [Bacteroidetes bacterium]|nr:MAG: hypothetical protein FD155_1821 [Bacteroidota bacterium]